MYFKKLNVLDRSDHVPLVRKTAEEESKEKRKVRKKSDMLGWESAVWKKKSDGCATEEKREL